MDFTYFAILPGYYNAYGSTPLAYTNTVFYNGTPKTGGSGDNPSYSLVADESVSQALLDIWNEWAINNARLTADEANIATNTTDIATINTDLGNLVTSDISYDGAERTGGGSGDPTYSLTDGVDTSATIPPKVWDEFVLLYAAIADVATGVTQETLDNTMDNVVVDFATGINNTSNALLVGTFANGSASIGGQYTVYAGGTISVSASQDNYVYLKTDTTLTYLHVNNGAGQPATPAGSIVLWKLVTDGTHISSATDLRNTFPFVNTQVKGGLLVTIGSPVSGGTNGELLYVDGGGNVGNDTLPDIIGYIPENAANKATDFGTLNNTLYPTTQATDTEIATQIADADIPAILGYTPEDVANKATDFSTVNNTLYPTTEAVDNEITAKIGTGAAPNIINLNFGLSPYTVTSTYFNNLILCDVSGGAITINLPAPTSPMIGQTFHIAVTTGDISSNNILVQAVGAANVKGSAIFTMNTANKDLEVINAGAIYTGLYS